MRPADRKELALVVPATGDSARTRGFTLLLGAPPESRPTWPSTEGNSVCMNLLCSRQAGDQPETESHSVARLTLLILMAQGAPGKPGRHVLKAEISLKGPRPQALIPATRNL